MMCGVLYLKFQMFLNSEVVADSGRCCIIEDAVLYCIQLNNIALLAEPTCLSGLETPSNLKCVQCL